MSYVLIVTQGWASGYEIQVALVKFSILAAVYSQVYFSQRNYHISAALLIDYEHRKAVSDTLTDFFSDGIQDEPLKVSTIAHATKTIYAPVTTGHLKNEQENTSIDSIVKQYLPADLGK